MATASSVHAPSSIPPELTQRAQWVTWCYVKRDGKQTKMPYDPTTGNPASSTDPATWSTFDDANDAMRRRRHNGIGYVFSRDDPFTGVDLDHCRDAETGEIAGWASPIINVFFSYAEISPSGEGVHVFIKARMPEGSRHKCGNYEAYDAERFFTVTGQHLEDTLPTIEARQDELDHFIMKYLPQRQAATAAPAQRVHRGGVVDVDDSDILATALNDAKFAALWYGDTSGYPSASEAVFALLRKLEFYTRGDADHMDRFFRQSGLMSDKWDSRRGDSTLGAYNIQKILGEPGDHASYLHLLKRDTSEPGAEDEANDTPDPEPETVQVLRARIAELEVMVATRDETIVQLENELAGSRDANVRLNREITELKEYKRSRDESEERRQVINALPSERLSVTDKLVLDCGIRLIRSAQSRGTVREDGGVQFPLGAAADEYDISTDTASKSVRRLESLGYWTRDYESELVEKVDPETGQPVVDPKTGKPVLQWIKRLILLPREEYLSHPIQAVEAAEEVQATERNHGGKRIRCEKCNSDDVLTQTIYFCRTCNHEWRSEPRDANRPMQEEETAPDATSAENFRYPQDAAFEDGIYLMPQVAAIGNNRPARRAPASTSRPATPSLCLQERDQHANTEKMRKPQDAGIAQVPESPERRQQQRDLFEWARDHNWERLRYAPATYAGGDETKWGIFLRGSNTHLTQAWAAISPDVVAS